MIHINNSVHAEERKLINGLKCDVEKQGPAETVTPMYLYLSINSKFFFRTSLKVKL